MNNAKKCTKVGISNIADLAQIWTIRLFCKLSGNEKIFKIHWA